MSSLFRMTCGTAVASLLATTLLQAQPGGAAPGASQDFEATFVSQFGSDLDNGGEMAMTRYNARFNTAWAIDRRSRLGIGFSYGVDTYDFSPSGATGVLANDPWGDIHSAEVGLSYFRALENGWRVFARPAISSNSESAFDSDGLRLSLVGGALTQVSEKLQIGVGLVFATGLEETQVIPFLSVQWEFAEGWTLQNPFRPGPTGPAGLEIAYAGEGWSLAFGGAYRNWRFRLDEDAAVSEGIGEYSSVPLFIRYTRTVSEQFAFDLYGGYLVGAQLELEDKNGRGLGLREDVDSAPFVAAAISGRF